MFNLTGRCDRCKLVRKLHLFGAALGSHQWLCWGCYLEARATMEEKLVCHPFIRMRGQVANPRPMFVLRG